MEIKKFVKYLKNSIRPLFDNSAAHEVRNLNFAYLEHSKKSKCYFELVKKKLFKKNVEFVKTFHCVIVVLISKLNCRARRYAIKSCVYEFPNPTSERL